MQRSRRNGAVVHQTSITVGRQLWRDCDCDPDTVTVTVDGHKESHAGGHRPNATATEHEHEHEIEEPGYGRRGAGLRRDACCRHLWLTSCDTAWGGASGHITSDRNRGAGEYYRQRADNSPIRNPQFVGGAPPGGRHP